MGILVLVFALTLIFLSAGVVMVESSLESKDYSSKLGGYILIIVTVIICTSWLIATYTYTTKTVKEYIQYPSKYKIEIKYEIKDSIQVPVDTIITRK